MTIGAGVQPVPGPTLPEVSSAARNAWLRNGSLPASRSHATASMSATPGAMRAISSDSWSAIGFPYQRVGVNPRLLALRGVTDRPAVDRHPLPDGRDPRLTQRGAIDREEVGRGQPQFEPAPERRLGMSHHQAAPNR